jgi:hypothetical protein
LSFEYFNFLLADEFMQNETWRKWLLMGVAVCLLASLSGCGSSDGLVQVSGLVTYDGAPIPEGTIQFRALEGDQKAYASPSGDGKYEARVEPGPASVEVRASRIVEGKFDESNPGEKVPVGEMYIPEKYNSRTELKVTVESDKLDENFDLVSK